MTEPPSVPPSDHAAATPPSGTLRRADELAVLNTIAETLNRSADLDEALTHTLELVAGLLGLHSGWLWLEDEQGRFSPMATYNLPPVLQDPEHMTGWHCLCLKAFLEGSLRGAANINVLECSRLEDEVDGTDGLRYHATIPIYLGGRRIGVMNVAMPEWRRLGAEDLRFLYTVGYQVGLAVEHSRLLGTRTRLAQVEERNRLAREIHDTVAQQLAGLALQLEAADALVERDPERGRQTLRRAIDLTHTTLDDVRRSVLDLRAAPLEGLPLHQALRRLVRAFGREQGVKASLRLRGPVRALSPRIELGVFRVAQEALSNVAHHAGAQRIVVTLDLGPAPGAPLRLIVADDGRGFAAGEPPARPPSGAGHFGLVGMQERARLLGGALAVASASGSGTRITLDVPGAAA